MNLIPMQFNEYEVNVFFDEDNNPWWPAQGPCAVLEIRTSNISQVMARLPEHQKRLFTLKTNRGLREMWCINEGGLYTLMLTSRKPQAEAFRCWITDEVLPQIRKTGRYQLTDERFLRNMQRSTQVEHAKNVGAQLSALGGRGACIHWYRSSLKGITGAEPKQWRETGKQYNLPGKVCQRGREVVRVLQPAGACGASLADDLVVSGMEKAEAIAIGRDSKALFQRILDAGVMPAELHSSPLDGIEE
jgi:prophage antirepressor-like protein